jgi:hypothetical protein
VEEVDRAHGVRLLLLDGRVRRKVEIEGVQSIRRSVGLEVAYDEKDAPAGVK